MAEENTNTPSNQNSNTGQQAQPVTPKPEPTPATPPAVAPTSISPQNTETQVEKPTLGEKKEENTESAKPGFVVKIKGLLGGLLKNKGVIIAVIIVIIAIIFGIISLAGMGESEQYQGLIKKVEEETAALKNGE